MPDPSRDNGQDASASPLPSLAIATRQLSQHASPSPSYSSFAKRRAAKAVVICRTCGRCRTKKVKCDGTRPSCQSCVASGHSCHYPEDARKSGRPTKAEVLALQNEVAAFRKIFKNRGSVDTIQEIGHRITSTDKYAVNHPVPAGGAFSDVALGTPSQSSHNNSPETRTSEALNGASPLETHILCAISEDGSIAVHGATSHMRDPAASTKPGHDELVSQDEQEVYEQSVRDQLFANAAYQRQRESAIFGNPRSIGIKVELDGLPMDLALHLLDLHFNRQHFAYLLTYRPAIMESLTNDGPYANKLLLNAIYYCSCLYSDRTIFRSNLDDPDTMGDEFYTRFKQLLMDEIDKPSLPSIAALLICGSTLVSNGKQSAGWVLCGIAYRMVTDLGCQLSIPARRDLSIATSRLTAMEIEIRRRIYWGAFLTDKFQSLYLGRPSALRPSDARVSKKLLDLYEELETWSPYVDPISTPTSTHLAGFQGPRPVYAISTFQALIPLAEIAYAIANTFYTLDCTKVPGDKLLKAKHEIQTGLDIWIRDLPAHLHFDPSVDPTPPPNQITPHATYHTLIILLERPFLSNGHLSFVTDPASQAAGERICATAAIAIWHLVDAYKRAFTLRRTPYFLSYATYSAIVVILNQPESESGQYQECIRFFWFALLDFLRGCNSGLRKPLKILQKLMHRLGRAVPHLDSGEIPAPSGGQESSAASRLPNNSQPGGVDFDPTLIGGASQTPWYGDIPGLDSLLQQSLELDRWATENWVDTMADGQQVMDDSLFGLFTPEQFMMQGYGNPY